ncbi:hypothetical protein WEIDD23_00473 [Weissella sp. DD23]|nr:hypothetical protein WEIDD23_00473 [Weissella sp. DD23]
MFELFLEYPSAYLFATEAMVGGILVIDELEQNQLESRNVIE